jgi:hypothetical protein
MFKDTTKLSGMYLGAAFNTLQEIIIPASGSVLSLDIL